MLSRLFIKNIAIIDELQIDFFDGFNCLTGETGAGKSILIDSIGAVLGAKTSREIIRSGEKTATVTAVFDNIGDDVKDALDSLSIDYEDDSLTVTRKMYEGGKNVCRVNSEVVGVGVLKALGALLVNIHGQSDSDELMRDDSALKFLDEFGGTVELVEKLEKQYRLAKSIQRELEEIRKSESERLKMIDMLAFEVDEIDKSKIYVGEKAELERQKSIANNSIKLRTLLTGASEMLDGETNENNAVSLLFDAAKSLTDAGEIDRSVYPLAEELNGSAYAVSELATRLVSVIDELDETSYNIDEIEQRLDLIYNLSRKYGEDEQAILDFAEKARGELEKLRKSDERAEELNEQFKESKLECRATAEELSRIRHEKAVLLERSIEKELGDLCMGSTVFKVNFEQKKISADGTDDVKFYISTNRGESLKPLTKIASGGELSRIMLAIKNVFTAPSTTKTLIFDEIDRGVSGAAAESIGRKLYSVSCGRQVLVITHLPTVASYSDREYMIKKKTVDGRTCTDVVELDREGQVGELARLIGGDENDSVSREAGNHLLEKAEEWKNKKE